MISLSLRDYAKADIVVTEKEYLRGEPTLPLGLVLEHADRQADLGEDPDDYDA